MANPPVSRASLLAGLRTGGVRTASGPAPHTAAPGATFNINQPAFQPSQQPIFPEENEQVIQVPQHFNSFANEHHGGSRILPMTAAVDGPGNRFSQQQQRNNSQAPSFVPPFTPSNLNPLQAQAFQLQMMQLELMKIQAQNYQAEVLAQAQRQAQQPQNAQLAPNNRQNGLFNPPATAGPTAGGFDLRSATLSAQMRRANQTEQARSLSGNEDVMPMTAALGGKFGSRTLPPNGLPMKYNEDTPLPQTPNTTTVISGGTPLGSPAPNSLQFNNNNSNNTTPSKSDAVSSWRRGGNTGLSGARSFTSPSVKVTPPPPELKTDAPLLSGVSGASTPSTATPGTAKFRPQPLRFSAAVSQPLPVVVAVDNDIVEAEEDSFSSSSSKSNNSGSPTTPPSSNEMPLSPREEASRKLYEGLGIGRPVSNNGVKPTLVVTEPGAIAAFTISSSYPGNGGMMNNYRMVSQPLRQPRGPPSHLEELAPQNFAARMKLQAMEGLGVVRTGVVEAY